MDMLLEGTTGLFNGVDLALWVLLLFVVPRLWRAGLRKPVQRPRRRPLLKRHQPAAEALKIAV
jgi:hypothetical protein